MIALSVSCDCGQEARVLRIGIFNRRYMIECKGCHSAVINKDLDDAIDMWSSVFCVNPTQPFRENHDDLIRAMFDNEEDEALALTHRPANIQFVRVATAFREQKRKIRDLTEMLKGDIQPVTYCNLGFLKAGTHTCEMGEFCNCETKATEDSGS